MCKTDEISSLIENMRLLDTYNGNINTCEVFGQNEPQLVVRKRLCSQDEAVRAYLEGFCDLAGLRNEGLGVRFRNVEEQVLLIQALERAGVPVPGIIGSGKDWMAYRFIEGSVLVDLIASQQLACASIRDHIRTAARTIRKTHEQHIVVGDRWGGNEIIGIDGTCTLIDFDIAWTGPFDVVKAVENSLFLVGVVGAGFTAGRSAVELALAVVDGFGLDREAVGDLLSMLEKWREYYRSGEHIKTGLARPPDWYYAFDDVLGVIVTKLREIVSHR